MSSRVARSAPLAWKVSWSRLAVLSVRSIRTFLELSIFSAYLLCSIDLSQFKMSDFLGGADRFLFLLLFTVFALSIIISLGEVNRARLSVSKLKNSEKNRKKFQKFEILTWEFSQTKVLSTGAECPQYTYHNISSNCQCWFLKFQPWVFFSQKLSFMLF